MGEQDNGPVERFLNLEIDAATFGHREHVEIAYRMLDAYDFVEACSRYANCISALALRHGAAEKYNTTITFAFMSLIAEHKSQTHDTDFDSFIAANPELLDKNLLQGWYTDERLASTDARLRFLLPDRVPGKAA